MARKSKKVEKEPNEEPKIEEPKVEIVENVEVVQEKKKRGRPKKTQSI